MADVCCLLPPVYICHSDLTCLRAFGLLQLTLHNYSLIQRGWAFLLKTSKLSSWFTVHFQAQQSSLIQLNATGWAMLCHLSHMHFRTTADALAWSTHDHRGTLLAVSCFTAQNFNWLQEHWKSEMVSDQSSTEQNMCQLLLLFMTCNCTVASNHCGLWWYANADYDALTMCFSPVIACCLSLWASSALKTK